MKRCPKCQRTYADDAFTFCLEDGALLSPPYDPEKKEEPLKTIQSGGPPPTAVLPATERSGRELPPTVKTAPSPTNAEEAKPQNRVHPESPRRTSPLKYVVIGLVALVIVATGFGFLGLYVAGTSNCPRLVISCSPSEPATYCSLVEDQSHTFNHNDSKPISGALCSRSVLLLQVPALPDEITQITWSASAGTIRSNNSQMSINTSGQAGKTIEVEANVTSSSWFCSTTVSTSFVVPSGFGPPKP
jgi:hypothetical protein